MAEVNVKKGDLVRVVLEGVVTFASGCDADGGFTVGTNGIYPEREHVKSIEIIKPPIKVGDVIPPARLAELKPGAVVRDAYYKHDVYLRQAEGWRTPGLRLVFADKDFPDRDLEVLALAAAARQ